MPRISTLTVMRRCLLSALVLLSAASLAHAQRDLKDIPPPDPELERAALELAEGFEINLFAADPQLAKPIQMNFDPAGRLWVATSEVYPHIAPGQPATDKILVLEDTNADGAADRTTVFADGLLIPTGLEPGDGGAYVANSTELVHLADTNGDGRADRRQTLLSGFGTEDTHHLIHTLRWGPDGRLYFNQSIYIHSHVETPHGVRRLGGGGIWQFHPTSWRLEVFARGWVNAWGHAFDRWGQSLVTDGAGGEGINYAFPGSVFPTAVGATRVLHGLNPGSPKYCGLEVVDGPHLPADWQGDLVTCDFRAHRVCRFHLEDLGSGYTARELPELVRTTHVAFRPVDVKQGPDGAIYLADWYNPIIQHGEVDFRDPRRDHTHGRIWRITRKGVPPRPVVNYLTAPLADVVAALDDPQTTARRMARRALRERPIDAAVAALDAWVAGLDPRAAGHEGRLLEALWTYQALDRPQPALARQLAAAQEPRVRAAAARVVAAWAGLAELPALDLLAAAARDEHPRVRLEAVNALRALNTTAATEAALAALDRPLDENLDFALWLLCRETHGAWFPAVAAATSPLGARPEALLFALEALDAAESVPPLISALEQQRIPDGLRSRALALVARWGRPEDLSRVLDALVEAGPPAAGDAAAEARVASLLGALREAAVRRRVAPAGDLARLRGFVDQGAAANRALACELVGLWRVADLRPVLAALAASHEAPLDVRRGAIAGLARFGGPARDALRTLAGSPSEPAIREAAVAALVEMDLAEAARLAVALWADPAADLDPSPLVAALLQRSGGPKHLVAALEGATLPPDRAKQVLRVARSGGGDPALVEALRRAGGLGAGPKQFTLEEIQQLLADVRSAGDPVRGEAVYRRQELNCQKCHAIGGAGGRVGPDLASIGASAQADYLLESLLEPNKKVKEGFHAQTVVTSSGLVQSGILVREAAGELVLRNAEDREVRIPLDEIDDRAAAPSLMPSGLADEITREELVDLVRFLSELGKVGPFALGKARLVRRWEQLPTSAANYELIRRQGTGVVARVGDTLAWSPVYSQVSGQLPLDALGSFATVSNQFMKIPPLSVVRFSLRVAAGGVVRLAVDDPQTLLVWVDGQPAEAAAHMDLDLAPGLHTVILGVDRARRTAPLRVELLDVPGSPARAELPVGP